MQRPLFLPPRVTDYGQVVAMAADFGLFTPGAAGGASLSAPVSPEGPGGGGNLGEGGAGGGPEGPGQPGVGGVGGGGGSGAGTVSGAELGGGGESGGLPFSGFPAALVAAVGGTLTATGAALARAVRRYR